MRPSGTRRQRGAYFTPEWLARELATWSIRSPKDTVLDPAAGLGDLLAPCIERLRALGAKGQPQVYGVEIHARTWRRLASRFETLSRTKQLVRADFFATIGRLPLVDVVIANPPYVRHQLIGDRARARMRAGANGRVDALDGKCSAWAYFLAAAPEILRPGGRLAMVLPTEVLSAAYSIPLIAELGSSFQKVEFVYCHGDVFAPLSQRIVLCFAQGYGRHGASRIECRRADIKIVSGQPQLKRRRRTPKLSVAHLSMTRLLAPQSALELEKSLTGDSDLVRLRELATVGIGYVTGHNRYFHLTEEQRTRYDIPPRHLRRVLARGKDITGVLFDREDWKAARDARAACWLFAPRDTHDRAVQNALARGRRTGVPRGFKCGSRDPWWAVPLKGTPPAFMRYMGDDARIVANPARVSVSNTLFELRNLREIQPGNLAVMSLTAVFRLSALLNARTMGGLRKLEPRDAGDIILPNVNVRAGVVKRLDDLLKDDREADAHELADYAVLRKGLGWSSRTIDRLRGAAECL